MNMPGFTAEFSLYVSHQRYQFGVTHAVQVDREIVPQGCWIDQYLGELCCCGSWGCVCRPLPPSLPV